MQTLRDLLCLSVERYAAHTALRYKRDGRWQTVRYDELAQRVRRVVALLRKLGIGPRDRVALLVANDVRWPELYFGIVSLGAVAVPIDARLQAREVAHILHDADARVIFLAAGALAVLRDIEPRPPSLEHTVVLDGAHLLPTTEDGLSYHDYAAVAAPDGDTEPPDTCFDERGPAPDDVASIIYTSGTTGQSKGAMLTHANFCANVRALLSAVVVTPADGFLLVLPLHHAFAFTANLLLPLAGGAEIAFVENLRTVSENMQETRPTVLIGVPLLFEKIYRKIWAAIRTKPVARLLWTLHLRTPVRSKIRAATGGRLRLCVVGGAPAGRALIGGFATLGIPLIEGYGLTETAPVLTLNPPDAPRPGTVGRAIQTVDLRIAAPDASGTGEVLARGPNIMLGYFRNEQATNEVIRDGWFHTGDLGSLDRDGYLTITGRRKSLIVNREGKNIHPEEVEQHLLTSPWIAECIVLGCRTPGETGERVGVIVVPDQAYIDQQFATRKSAPAEADVTAALRDDIRRLGRELADYKRPRIIQVRAEAFEKTSTGKVKRYLYAVDSMEV